MALFKNDSDGENNIIADINMTPLIDIMLVLLIIFMVTSSIDSESGVDVALPSSSTAGTKVTEQKDNSPVQLSIDRDGRVFVGSEAIDTAALKEKLVTLFAEKKLTAVVIRGDKKIELQKIIEIIDVAKEAGATEVSMATEGEANP